MTAPDVRGAHTTQQAAIPPDDLIETDTTLGGNPTVGCAQRYVPARNTIYGPLPELEHLLELTDPDPPTQ